MGDGYKNRGSNAAGLGFKNRGAKLLDGAAYANRGATDGTHETFKNRGQAWGTGVFYNRSVSDFASLSILGSAAFFAPLKSTLVLTRGTGNPTYTRATAAWEMDNEGKLITVPSGGARFGGGRMVRNLLTYTEDFGNAIWDKSMCSNSSNEVNSPIGTMTADKITINTATAQHILATLLSNSFVAGYAYTVSFYIKKETGRYVQVTLPGAVFGTSQYANIDVSAQSVAYSTGCTCSIIPISDGWMRISYTAVAQSTASSTSPLIIFIDSDSSARAPTFLGNGTDSFYIWGAQLENVTGQADQTASEYVSVGVLSAPYHGAGVDGVKWFETNKNGSAISESSMLGYHAEGARTNSLYMSRALDQARISWNLPYTQVGRWLSTPVGSELVTNGTFTTDASGWTLNNATAASVSGELELTQTGGVGGNARQVISVTPGKGYHISITGRRDTASGAATYGVTIIDGSFSSQYQYPADTSATTSIYFITPVNNTITIVLAVTNTVGSKAYYDNISCKEAAISATPCTGIDNAANSASTLTAAAADATILQTLSLAAAARSSSAYVKRRTGTGNIYMTRDGGTNWTDITASVGSSWTRVKIENTSVLNPSIGFKIATSGDAIDVDCVQDEAGAFISSPIITTSAAVTRNADALTYATASNWSDTAGWALASVYKPDWSYVAGGVIGSATNGLLPLTTNTGAKAYDGTNTVNGPAGSPSGTVKMAMNWGSGALQVAANGTAGTAGSYDGAWGLASIGINNSAGAMYSKNVYIAQSALTATQLAQVTA